MTVRVLIVDDHPVYRAGLRLALESEPDVEVVGEATDGDGALVAALALRPDVVLMDLHMAGMNGVEATRRLVAEAPDIGVLVLTMSDDDESVFSAMRAGARGYLVKGAQQERIAGAVLAVASGEAVFGADVAGRVLAAFTAGARRVGPFPMLSEREVEVLDLVAAGRSNTDIARRLVLSDKTVRNHVSNIFTKLDVADRSEAIVRARQAGLGEQADRTS